MHQQQTAVENIVRKGEIARNDQFLLFPQCFLPKQIIVSPFVHIFDIVPLFGAKFEKPKMGISGKGIRLSPVAQWITHRIKLFTKRQNLRPVKFESICRQHFKCSLNDDLCY